MPIRILVACLFVFIILLPRTANGATVVFDKTFPNDFTTLDPAGNIYAVSGSSVTKLGPAGNVIYSHPLPSGIIGNWSGIRRRNRNCGRHPIRHPAYVAECSATSAQ